MSRRWIDPDLFTDEKLGKASPAERLLFVAMVANQDDDGRLLGHPGYLRSIAFPYDDFSNEEVKQTRDHLAEVNANIIIYQNSGDEYIQLKRHYRYQRPRYYHPQSSRRLRAGPSKTRKHLKRQLSGHKATIGLLSSYHQTTKWLRRSRYRVAKRLPDSIPKIG